jgi:hypothetical protein
LSDEHCEPRRRHELQAWRIPSLLRKSGAVYGRNNGLYKAFTY